MSLGIDVADFLSYAAITFGSLGVLLAAIIGVRFVVQILKGFTGRR